MLCSVSAANSKRSVELDFIRGIAILAVIDFHSPSQALFTPLKLLGFHHHFGWAGVQLFFVLSGFLIGNLLIGEWNRTKRIDVSRFLLRRAFKIWPQYYVYLFVVLLTRHRTLHSLLGNFISVQNYTNGIPHTWSLAVEEHSYLLIVVLFSLAAIKEMRKRSLIAFIFCVAIVTSLLRLLLACQGTAIYFTTHTQLDGICYGLLLAMLQNFEPKRFHILQKARFFWFAIVGAALLFFYLDPAALWAQAVAFDVGVWMSIALFMLICRPITRQHSVPYRLVARTGVLSYGIYLWHVSTIAPIIHLGARIPVRFAPLWIAAMPLVAAVGVGAVATWLVEVPLLQLRERLLPVKALQLAQTDRSSLDSEAPMQAFEKLAF